MYYTYRFIFSFHIFLFSFLYPLTSIAYINEYKPIVPFNEAKAIDENDKLVFKGFYQDLFLEKLSKLKTINENFFSSLPFVMDLDNLSSHSYFRLWKYKRNNLFFLKADNVKKNLLRSEFFFIKARIKGKNKIQLKKIHWYNQNQILIQKNLYFSNDYDNEYVHEVFIYNIYNVLIQKILLFFSKKKHTLIKVKEFDFWIIDKNFRGFYYK